MSNEPMEETVKVNGYSYVAKATPDRDGFTLRYVREQICIGDQLIDQDGRKYSIKESRETVDGLARLIVGPFAR